MLLSRAADGLYWIARYLERAEHTARLIEVGLDLGLGRPVATTRGAADRLYGSLGLSEVMQGPSARASLVAAALFDPSNRCLLYTSPSPRDRQKSRMPSSA